MGKIVVGNKKSNRPATFITKAKRRRMNNKKKPKGSIIERPTGVGAPAVTTAVAEAEGRDRHRTEQNNNNNWKKLCRVECTRQNGILMIVTTACETGLGNGARIRTRTSTDIDSSGGNKG